MFLRLHFFLGFLGGSLFSIIGHVLPLPMIALFVLVLLLSIFAALVVVRKRRKTAQSALDGTSLELWHEGICPVCLALYAANQMRSAVIVDTTYADTVESIQNGKGSLTHGNNF